MVTCTKCPAEATYDSPENLCDQHWAEWWVDGLGARTPEERDLLMKETLDFIANDEALSGAQYGEPERVCTRKCGVETTGVHEGCQLDPKRT